jgi:hypothetical protein
MADLYGDGRPRGSGDDSPGEGPQDEPGEAPQDERGEAPQDQPGAEPGDEPRAAAKPEPPYQALLPNLDRLSRSSFDRGTVSRRRINRALAVLGVVAALVVLTVVLVPLLTR